MKNNDGDVGEVDGMPALKVGDQVRDFTLPDQDAELNRLSDYWSSRLLLYFTPTSSSPGFSVQTINLQLNFDKLKNQGIFILGISGDSPEKLRKFSDKLLLSFPLLSDKDYEVSKSFGVWGLKDFFGKAFYGIRPSCILLEPLGKVEAMMINVDPKEQTQWLASLFGLEAALDLL